ncbi:MAG TPA: RCC1 domain-containing protein [Polyangia bacterium]
MAGGGFHTCAATADGAVSCWGSNDSGQLGDGTTTARLAPTTVTGVQL